MNEKWKDIVGYEGLYQVSNLGRVKSLQRTILCNTGVYTTVNERILSAADKGLGYMVVGLNKNGIHKTARVHRLVAVAFIPNPNGFSLINHKDKNPKNNRIDNLEWCDYKYNNNYADHNLLLSKSQSFPVLQYSIDGKFIARYYGATEASKKLGIDKVSIRACCRGKLQTSGGYIWKYENSDKDISKPIFKPFNSKMSRETVLTIKKMLSDGKTVTYISKALNVNFNAVSNIKRGVTFRYI